jgi:hypothetical protein
MGVRGKDCIDKPATREKWPDREQRNLPQGALHAEERVHGRLSGI